MTKCLICDSDTEYFFSKTFTDYNLDKSDYLKCKNCGFVFNDQIINMSEDEWKWVGESLTIASPKVTTSYMTLSSFQKMCHC